MSEAYNNCNGRTLGMGDCEHNETSDSRTSTLRPGAPSSAPRRATHRLRWTSRRTLFTNIFEKFLEQNCCEYVTDEDEKREWAVDILQHVLIVGALCRDLLMNHAVKDIYILLNLRELTKMQWHHLQKYHFQSEHQGMSCRCVFWRATYKSCMTHQPL